jgi:chromate reductase, NAD(P)H dehydrogenase (quinone)
MTKKICIISATSRSNFKLAQAIQKEFSSANLESEIIDLESLNLSLYSPEMEKKEIPKAAFELTERLVEAPACVLLAPEYNGGLSPVVVNAISWVSRTSADWRLAFNQKPYMMGTSSGGGGLKVIQVMSLQLQHLGAILLPRPVIVTSQKAFNPESVQANIHWLKSYLAN